MTPREEIVQQAMALPPEDRVYVADMLEYSLSGGGFATPEIAAAWATEIERRVAAHERGELPAAELDAVFVRLRQRLADRRANQVSP
jgi:putative addiction module component (TIGR02574 family)